VAVIAGGDVTDTVPRSAMSSDPKSGENLTEHEPHSLILACDFTVDSIDRMWCWIQEQQEALASIGTRHLVIYTSIWEPGRIFVTTGIRQQQPIRRILQSPKLFEWFDVSGVADVPPIFGGEVVEKIDLVDAASPRPDGAVVLGVISSVADVTALVARVRGAAPHFRSAGVRKVWIYRAFDDGQEVMILEEIDSEASVRKWIDKPDAAAEWMSQAGLGAYPPMFVGTVAHVMTVGSS
jgi:hypothetical protein